MTVVAKDIPPGVRFTESSSYFIKWSSVIAGVAIALSLEVLLNFFGMSIGLISFNFSVDLNKVGTVTLVWMAASGIISMFSSCWIIGKLLDTSSKYTLALHGIIIWSFATLITVTATATAGGVLIGGSTNILKSNLHKISQQALQKIDGANNSNPYSPMARFDEKEAGNQDIIDETTNKLGTVTASTFVSFLLSVIAGVIGATMGRNKLSRSYS